MKYPLYILLIGISYLTACSSSPDSQFPRYSDFAKTKALSAQVINLDTVLLRYPFRVAVRTVSLLSWTYIIWIIIYMHLPIRDGNTLPHSVDVGKGSTRNAIGYSIQFNSLDSLWALDANKMEITRWKISPATGSAERVEEIKLDKKLVRSLDFHTMESGFLVPTTWVSTVFGK